MIMGADSERLRRQLASSLPTGTRAAELFVETRAILTIANDPSRGTPRVERRWESGAHLRRFFEGRHESYVLDAPGLLALESLILHPGAIGTPPLPGEQADPEEIDPGDLWTPRFLDRALALAGRAPARLEAQHQEVLVISTERETARDTRTIVEISMGTPATRRAAASIEELERAGRKLHAADGPVRPARGGAAPPGGAMPVVFAPPSGGLLLHEICGHLLEADHVLAGYSPFAGARGEAIASPLLSLSDDGSVPGLCGSARFDDEGVPTRRTPLIVKGTLVGYLSTRLTAHATDRISTGNARRQTYRDAPLPRMTNLVIDPGEMDDAEILASTPRGLLVRRLGRGQVDPSTGRFMLTVVEGMLIDQGRIVEPVSGMVLRGVAHEALAAIDAVGRDAVPDPAGAICVKEDQAVSFGTLQPTLRVAALHVGEAGR